MTINEAIKALERYFFTKPSEKLGELDEAAKLGLEALKRTRNQRVNPNWKPETLLPGETEE